MTSFVVRDSTQLGVDRILTSTTTQALYDNPIAILEGNRPAGKAAPYMVPRILLEEKTVSIAQAQLDFTGVTGYEIYELEFAPLIPTTDGGVPYLQMSTDNGSTFESGASSYRYATLRGTDTSSSAAVGDNTSALIYLTGAIGVSSNTAYGMRGMATLFCLGSSSLVKSMRYATDFLNNAGGGGAMHSLFGGGWGITNLTTSAVNALRVAFGSGNVAVGSIVRLYGRSP